MEFRDGPIQDSAKVHHNASFQSDLECSTRELSPGQVACPSSIPDAPLEGHKRKETSPTLEVSELSPQIF